MSKQILRLSPDEKVFGPKFAAEDNEKLCEMLAMQMQYMEAVGEELDEEGAPEKLSRHHCRTLESVGLLQQVRIKLNTRGRPRIRWQLTPKARILAGGYLGRKKQQQMREREKMREQLVAETKGMTAH